MDYAQPQSDILIEARDLRKRYDGINAVDGVSFTVRRGEILGMLGPNGAGKTTTVEILEGLRTPDSGDAFVNGIDVKKEPRKVKSIIGVQLQHNAFFDQLTIAETLQLFATLYQSDIDISHLLEQVGLAARGKSKFKELSGGMKQRVSIAVALVNTPVAMFLDEPTVGLDPQTRRNLWQLIRRLRKDGKAIVLTTHYMEEAEDLCDRVAIMDHGRVIAIDTPENLVHQLQQRGAESEHRDGLLNLEDVFLDLTGRSLKDEDIDDDN